jgi:hypothetical protein
MASEEYGMSYPYIGILFDMDIKEARPPFDKLRVNGSECCVASIPVRAELVEA